MTGKALADLRKLDRAQITKACTKDELISAILAQEDNAQASLNESVMLLVNEIRDLRTALAANAIEVRELKNTIKENDAKYESRLNALEAKASKQDEIAANHQGFFEQFDATQRETKLVVLYRSA